MRTPLSFRDAPDRGHRLPPILVVFAFLVLARPLPGATFAVTNVNDSGVGSLRQAIINANASAGLDTITFQIPGSVPFTINVLSALPALNEAVVLDATTQPGYVNHPVIELNGATVGIGGTVGLRVGTNSTIRGLAINRFSADGIRLDGGGNTLQGNYIGTDVNGTLARGNGQYGVFVFGTGGNTIGGTNAAQRNVISGGNDTGIYLLNSTATGNVIQGNYLGLNAAGTASLGNTNNGIAIYNAPTNTVGGTLAGARNVISGNGGSGIYLNGGTARANLIQGNFLGVNAAGSASLGNAGDGITLNSAPGNFIGGTNAGAGNIISGNSKGGILLNSAGASANRLEGNYVGTDPTGLVALGNAFAGITLSGAVSNTIGGLVASARNLISGNRLDGVYATNSIGNSILGNFIGVNVSGSAALSNAFTGVTLDGASYNTLGGNPSGGRAVVAANGDIGVWIKGITARSNTVAGVFIGTGVGGTNALGNVKDGLRITDGSFNQIGGLTAAERNVLSGNGFVAGVGAGLLIEGVSASGNTISGNYLGTDVNGLLSVSNYTEGIYLDRARGNFIGGDVAGAGNLISGNRTRGLRATNAWANVIRGNYFGTTSNGVSSLANGQFNLELEENSSSNTIGGLTLGSGNRLAFSGGGFAAVRVRDLSTNNALLGNAIFSNSGLGIDISASGISLNDGCDGDSGGNQLQNFPVLAQAYSGVNTAVRGTLNSAANKTFRLQFFASPACDASGNGEGQVYLGDQLVTTTANCTNGFVALLPGAVTPGSVITATATDPASNTSEFSACLAVLATPKLNLLTLPANQVSLAWPNTAPGFTLKQATNLVPPVVWSTVTNVPANSGGQFVVTLSPSGGQRYYRLNFE